MTWDILIRGGTLYDGSSRPGERGDVAIADGRIAKIRRDLSGSAERVIDAAGLAVTPGFIDIKTHSDFTLPINPKAESKVRQGVTTEIIGHCGFSVAPVLPGAIARRLSERRCAVAGRSARCGFRNISTPFPRLRSTPGCWSATTPCV